MTYINKGIFIKILFLEHLCFEEFGE